MLKRLALFIIFCAVLPVFFSCRIKETDILTETIVVTKVETVVETVEVEKRSPYTYEILRGMAETGNYIGSPAAGHSIAFANIDGGLSYPDLVKEGILEEWIAAGGTEDSILLLDNMADREKALENARAAFDFGAEVLIEFQIDAGINALIGSRASENGIYVIAVEVPVPGYPVMGIDNYGAAVLAGDWVADRIDTVYAGWDDVDRVVYLSSGDTGDRTSLRIYGLKVELIERFGDGADDKVSGSKAIMFEDIHTAGDAGKATGDLMDRFPEDENIIVFCLNDSAAEGVYRAALEKDRWDPNKWILVSYGLDEKGKELVRNGIIDADIAFFPEKYGRYLIPAALAHIYGNPVPPYIFMENAVVTSDNIEDYYK